MSKYLSADNENPISMKYKYPKNMKKVILLLFVLLISANMYSQEIPIILTPVTNQYKVCQNQNYAFIIDLMEYQNDIVKIEWIGNANLIGAKNQNLQYINTDVVGKHSLTLNVEVKGGLKGKANIDFEILPLPSFELSEEGEMEINKNGKMIEVKNASNNIEKFIWQHDKKLVSNSKEKYELKQQGKYFVIANNKDGCINRKVINAIYK